MVTHTQWESAISEARKNYAKWNARYESSHGVDAKRRMLSAQLRLNALQDAFAHDRSVHDSLTIIEENMNRFAPESAVKLPSEGAMLTYGEVGQLQGAGMKTAKINVTLSEEAMKDIEHRGTLVNSDAPTRFETVPGGDYNAAVVYSRAVDDQAFQLALSKADEYRKNGAEASREDLAYWELRDKGFDAIQHANGDVTALYPRQQVKHISDMVNKSSREYVTPTAAPAASAPAGGALVRTDSYTAPSMLATEKERTGWLMEAAYREGNTSIQKIRGGDYSLSMGGKPVLQGSLERITDEFLARTTTPSHLRASLVADGMDLKFDGKQYSIIDNGRTAGTGATLYDAMQEARYRPRTIDGRFGPRNVEVTPEGSHFEYSPQGIRGPLADVSRYSGNFMDVAEEEGKRAVASTANGKLSQGHDGAYTVEIPQWGIREKFSGLTEAQKYLDGNYKEYGNVQRLANERGYIFGYDPKRGFVVRGATGTFAVSSIDDVGKVLAKTPDPRWAPGGQYEAGVTLKDSADATRLPVDTMPSYGKFADRGALGKEISKLRTSISTFIAPARATIARLEHEYGITGLSNLFSKVVESLKTSTNQSYVDVMKVDSIRRLYNFSDADQKIIESVRSALGEEARQKVLDDFNIPEGSPRRPAIIDAAARLKIEFYDKIFSRTGQDPDKFLVDYAQKHMEFKAQNSAKYREMELSGPDGMKQLIQMMYGGRVPDDLRFQALHERVADMDAILKEENAFTKASMYAQAANRWTYAMENLKDFYDKSHGKGVPDRVQAVASHYIDEALNAGQSDAARMLRGFADERSGSPKRPLMSFLQTTAGMGTYGFRPSSAVTILDHNYLIGSGYLGTEAMNRGFEATSKGGLEHLQEKFKKGVISGRVPVLGGFGDSSMGGSFLARIFTKVSQASTFFVQNGHILGRSSVYDAASWLFDRHIKPWVDGGKLGDWNSKAHDIRSHLLDKGVADQVEALLKGNDYEGAKHAYAQNMTDQIAFSFRPEDQGWALNKGMLAKMYGQLMVVPTQYLSAITRLTGSGSFLDRTQSLATLAKNTAAFYGAGRLAGLSGTNLLPWRVVTLRGGPLWQNVVSLTSQNPMGGNRASSAALKAVERSLEALSPGVPQAFQAAQVVKELQAGHPWAAFLTATGFSVRPDLRPPK